MAGGLSASAKSWSIGPKPARSQALSPRRPSRPPAAPQWARMTGCHDRDLLQRQIRKLVAREISRFHLSAPSIMRYRGLSTGFNCCDHIGRDRCADEHARRVDGVPKDIAFRARLGCLSARRRDHARTQRMSSSAGSASHSGPDRYCGLVLMPQGITTLVRTPYALGYIAKERLPQAPGDDHGATLRYRGREGIQSRSSA